LIKSYVSSFNDQKFKKEKEEYGIVVDQIESILKLHRTLSKTKQSAEATIAPPVDIVASKVALPTIPPKREKVTRQDILDRLREKDQLLEKAPAKVSETVQ
jgi:hypothetical protein